MRTFSHPVQCKKGNKWEIKLFSFECNPIMKKHRRSQSQFEEKQLYWELNKKNILKFKDSPYTQIAFECSDFLVREKDEDDQFTISENRFKKLIPILLEQNYGKYLAVVGNNQYEIGDDEDELFDLVTEMYGDVPMYIDKIIPVDEREIVVMPPKVAIIDGE